VGLHELIKDDESAHIRAGVVYGVHLVVAIMFDEASGVKRALLWLDKTTLKVKARKDHSEGLPGQMTLNALRPPYVSQPLLACAINNELKVYDQNGHELHIFGFRTSFLIGKKHVLLYKKDNAEDKNCFYRIIRIEDSKLVGIFPYALRSDQSPFLLEQSESLKESAGKFQGILCSSNLGLSYHVLDDVDDGGEVTKNKRYPPRVSGETSGREIKWAERRRSMPNRKNSTPASSAQLIRFNPLSSSLSELPLSSSYPAHRSSPPRKPAFQSSIFSIPTTKCLWAQKSLFHDSDLVSSSAILYEDRYLIVVRLFAFLGGNQIFDLQCLNKSTGDLRWREAIQSLQESDHSDLKLMLLGSKIYLYFVSSETSYWLKIFEAWSGKCVFSFREEMSCREKGSLTGVFLWSQGSWDLMTQF